MVTYRLYIGSNNDTKVVELDKIEKVLNSRHEGYTIMQSMGYWRGTREDSVIVTVSDDQPKILESIRQLKEVLRQEAIGYQQEAEEHAQL